MPRPPLQHLFYFMLAMRTALLASTTYTAAAVVALQVSLKPFAHLHTQVFCVHISTTIRPSCIERLVGDMLSSTAFQFGQKMFRFDSIQQSDKFAACTLIFKQ